MSTYALVRPCPKCPFRTDVDPYLRPERATEIATTVQSGGQFYCHQTTVEDPDDDSQMTEDADSKVCAGSLILMEKAGTPNQMMRIAERLGVYDPQRLDMDAPVPSSWGEWQRRYVDDPEEIEPCGIVGPDCMAPAGFAIGGGVVESTESADGECPACGVPCCSACMTSTEDGPMCPDCAGEED